jgi:hypothetical protein
MTDPTNWCAGALPGDAPTHQEVKSSLKALAANALRDSDDAPTPHQKVPAGAPEQRCSGASGALGASGATENTAVILKTFAKRIGIPVATVDRLSTGDLTATAEQLAACKGHLDRDGNPLAKTLLTFYLHALAARISA